MFKGWIIHIGGWTTIDPHVIWPWRVELNPHSTPIWTTVLDGKISPNITLLVTYSIISPYPCCIPMIFPWYTHYISQYCWWNPPISWYISWYFPFFHHPSPTQKPSPPPPHLGSGHDESPPVAWWGRAAGDVAVLLGARILLLSQFLHCWWAIPILANLDPPVLRVENCNRWKLLPSKVLVTQRANAFTWDLDPKLAPPVVKSCHFVSIAPLRLWLKHNQTSRCIRTLTITELHFCSKSLQ